MLRIRWLLPIAILVIIAGVGTTYYVQRDAVRQEQAVTPKPLSTDLNAAASDWKWSQSVAGRQVVEVRAKNFQQVKDPPRFDLQQLDLRLFHKDGKQYDQVKSASAQFFIDQGRLFTDGDVEITMGVPIEGALPGRLLTISSSGVSFESKTGKASTDRPARFAFDQGEGQAVGADYDPATRELRLRGQVELRWRGKGPDGKLMRVETSELIYREAESKVYLQPWSRLVRDTLTLDAGAAVVTLEEGVIRDVDAQQARGADRPPKRQVEYAASRLMMRFSEKGQVVRIVGEGEARLVAVSDSGRTTVNSDRVDMNFVASDRDSTLSEVVANGHGRVESQPLARAGVPVAETRVLRAEVIELKMRPGGEEIQELNTHAPGTLELLPSRAGQRARRLDAERMWINYAAANRIETLRGVNVSTRTEPETTAAIKPQVPAAPSLTSSRDMTATFDPKSGALARIEQWHDFRWEEGPRKARAERAMLEQSSAKITLTGVARIWDPAGSTAADEIVLDQKTGDTAASGKVRVTREPDRQAGATAVLSGEQSLHAQAERMTTSDRNQKIRYDGNALLWQGASRLQADRIEIDRTTRQLRATGHVISQLPDSQPEPAGARAAGPKPKQGSTFTMIHASDLAYSDRDRVAHYGGGVVLTRPGLTVKAERIRGYLAEQNTEVNNEAPGSSLDTMFADGRVEILQTASDRTRRGTSEHAEYYSIDGKVLLEGGAPQLVDSRRGDTRGKQLIWYANNDRLLVDGAENKPAVSRLRRK